MVGCSLPQSASGGCQLPQLPSIGRMLAATVAIGRMLYALVGCQLPQSPLVGCCMQGWYAGLASHLLFMFSNAGHVSSKFSFDFARQCFLLFRMLFHHLGFTLAFHAQQCWACLFEVLFRFRKTSKQRHSAAVQACARRHPNVLTSVA